MGLTVFPIPAPAAGGGMTLLSTATPSAATSLSFTSIPTTYKTLLVTWTGVFQSAAGYWTVRLNNDSGSNYDYWGSFKTSVVTYDGGGAQTAWGGNESNAPIPRTAADDSDKSLTSTGHLWIFNADETTANKSAAWAASGFASSPGEFRGPIAMLGRYRGTSAISQIDFIRNTTQTITGTFKLYGVA